MNDSKSIPQDMIQKTLKYRYVIYVLLELLQLPWAYSVPCISGLMPLDSCRPEYWPMFGEHARLCPCSC